MMSKPKLVRDKIPEIILKNDGVKPKIAVLNDKQYFNALLVKLKEECREFTKDNNSEELADILEVVYALSKALGISEQSLNLVRQKKARERGRFEKKIKLF